MASLCCGVTQSTSSVTPAPAQVSGTSKTAVDATAKSYWEAYFGAYGSEWVRKIPRRVLAYLHAKTKLAEAKGELIPSALVRDPATGGFTLEASVKGAKGERLFVAVSLDKDGKITKVRGMSVAAVKDTKTAAQSSLGYFEV